MFFADSGSVVGRGGDQAGLQFQRARGRADRTRLLTVRGGYHGDTFGAMAVCDPVGGMHSMFAGVLAEHVFAERPPDGFDAGLDERWAAQVRELVARHADELAAIIVEPVVQGAGGMRFHSPACVALLRELCDEHGLLLVLDEIATGFGRTGELFACEHAGVAPDVMCVGKALTGGYMTLAATLCTREVADAVSRRRGRRADARPHVHGQPAGLLGRAGLAGSAARRCRRRAAGAHACRRSSAACARVWSRLARSRAWPTCACSGRSAWCSCEHEVDIAAATAAAVGAACGCARFAT